MTRHSAMQIGIKVQCSHRQQQSREREFHFAAEELSMEFRVTGKNSAVNVFASEMRFYALIHQQFIQQFSPKCFPFSPLANIESSTSNNKSSRDSGYGKSFSFSFSIIAIFFSDPRFSKHLQPARRGSEGAQKNSKEPLIASTLRGFYWGEKSRREFFLADAKAGKFIGKVFSCSRSQPQHNFLDV